jgi:choline dehydrogenase-like flavoprotein
MAGLETAVALASPDGPDVEVIERGASNRKDHIHWDPATYPGDEKTQRWRSDGWGIGGGLSERLGGRSLCYHGVLLGIEEEALKAWPEEWVSSFAGEDGGYARFVQSLEPRFPELRERGFSEAAQAVGLKHVPQAAELDRTAQRLRAYSPLRPALRMEASNEHLRISRGSVERLKRVNGKWAVDILDADGNPETREGFDVCVLAASAIANVQILARTFAHDVETAVTDHFSLGLLARLPPGNELEGHRHKGLWVGYLPRPQLAANLFVHEMEPMENGDRLVKVAAVAEQGAGPQDFSNLSIVIDDGRTSDTYIDTRISLHDRRRLGDLRDELTSVMGQIAQMELEDVTGAWGGFAVPPPRGLSEPGRNNAQWRGHDNALQTLMDQPRAGIMAFYDFPYGAFEHEACTHPVGGQGPLAMTTDLELKELPGVYAIGPGCFPRMGAANPAITIMVMARVLAGTLRERYL